MKKTLLNKANGQMKGLLLMLVCMMTSLVASAAVDWKTFEVGVKYQFPAFVDAHYKFTPTEDGVLRIYKCGSTAISVSTEGNDEQGVVLGKETSGGDWISYVISSWKFKGSDDADGTHWNGYNEASLKAGKTYYILATGSINNTGEYFKGEYESGVNEMKLVDCNFEQGKVFDMTDTRHGQLELTFNMNADADSSIVTIGRKINSKIETRTSTNSGKLGLVLKDSLSKWLDAGLFTEGEEMTITIPNVHAATDASIKYGTDGTLVLKFLTPGKPHTLVDKKLPNPFLSYWNKGDENGMAVLTFDADVMAGDEQTVTGSLLVGYAELDDVYFEDLDKSAFRAEGNKLIIDFTDKLRTKEAMGLKSWYSTLRLSLKNIKMADGTNVFSSGAGTSGSFTFNIPFKEYKTNVAYEFTPADGAQLTDNNIKIYFSEKDAITFSGVKFTYQDQNDKKYQTIVSEGITSEIEGEDAIEYTIPITDEIKNGKNVRVYLVDVKSNDGLDHQDITAKYNPGPELVAELEPTKSSVADGSVVTELENVTLTFDEEVKVNPNADEKAATFTDTKTGKIVYAYVEPVDGNTKQVVITPAEELKNTHKYELNIGEEVVVNNQFVETEGKYGNYMPAKSYTVTLYAGFGNLDFMTSPIEGSTVNEISVITCTTLPGKSDDLWGISQAHRDDRHVYLKNADGQNVAEAKIGDIENGFSLTFTPAITEPGTYTVYLEDSVYFKGTDAYQGSEQNPTPVEFKYTVVAAPTELAFTVTPEDDSTISALDELVLKAEEDMYASETPIQAYANRKVYNGVLTVNPRNRKEAYIVFTDNEGMPITDEATYTVTIPAGVIGDKTWYDNDGLTGKCNVATTLYYTVGGASGDVTFTTNPENGSKVETLSKITITFSASEVGVGDGMIQVKKNGENVKRIDAEGVYESDDQWTTNVYEINYEATEDGVYTFEVPEGYFTDGNGDAIAGFTLTYTIGETTGINGISIDGNSADVYTLGGVKVSKAVKGLYIVNGKKIVVKK